MRSPSRRTILTDMLSWDCVSRANVLAFRNHGIDAKHVPIGFAENLRGPPPLPDSEKDIDLLFFGRV